MKKMRFWRNAIVIIASVFSIASCSCEAQWVDPEAHERTEQLQKEYTPLIEGTWHIEQVTERHRYFEQLTFQADGKLNGIRKWQVRQLVAIDGERRYTDWEDVEEENGTFSGTWRLQWERDDDGTGEDRICLRADFDSEEHMFVAYSNNMSFSLVDESLLRLDGFLFKNKDGWTEFQKGSAEPSF